METTCACLPWVLVCIMVWYFKYTGQSYPVVGYHGLKWNGKDFSQPEKPFYATNMFFINDETY